MNPCHCAERLRSFVANQLSAAEQAALDAHLRQCVPCQQALEALLDEPRGGAAGDCPALAAGRRAEEAGPLEPFLRDLLDNRPDLASSAAGTAGESASPTLRFPGPPTARGPLGRLESYHIMEELGRG